jgi:hypothetical protein
MKNLSRLFLISLSGLALLWSSGAGMAGYKAREWNAKTRENYAASLTSEGVTIAAEPLFTDELAARIFDKKDIVTRGIMPLALIIFNDNDYPIEVDGLSIEMLQGDEHFRSLSPVDAANHLFGKEKSPLNRSTPGVANEEAFKDFNDKFLTDKTVAAHDKAGGFLFIKIYNPKDLPVYLSTATVYIPNLYRGDDGSRLIYFEIDLKAAVKSAMLN